jgi:hypothetical protein
MKTTLLILLLLCFVATSLSAQTKNDSIIVKTGFFSNDYFINQGQFTKSKIREKLENNIYSFNSMMVYNSQKLSGYVFLALGLGLTAYALEDMNTSSNNGKTFMQAITPLFGIAVGVDLFALITINDSNYYFKKAIKEYNKGLNATTSEIHDHLKLYLAKDRFFLVWNM